MDHGNEPKYYVVLLNRDEKKMCICLKFKDFMIKEKGLWSTHSWPSSKVFTRLL